MKSALAFAFVLALVGVGACGGEIDSTEPTPPVDRKNPTVTTPTNPPQNPSAPISESPRLPLPPMQVGPADIGIISSTSEGDFAMAAGRLHQAVPGATIGEATSEASFGDYKVLVLVSSWADHDYKTIKAQSASLTHFVEAGGGLLIFQPNPFNFPGNHLRVDILPAWFDVENFYTDTAAEIVEPNHPLLQGISANEVPYPTDRISATSQEWKILARGTETHQGSLAVMELGQGRVAVDADNPGLDGRVSKLPTQSDRFLSQLVGWLSER